MHVVLRYGADSSLDLELPAGVMVTHCDAPRGEPLLNVAEAVDLALSAPLEFPPLAHCALPGDKVALALDHGVPQAAVIVARTVEVLTANGVSPRDITIVRPPASAQDQGPDPLGLLSDKVRSAIASSFHDPSHRESLSYLGATTQAKAIYMNRAVHDSDLVISIGCLRLQESLGYHGINSGVFPAFSDAANLERFRVPKASDPAERKRLRKQADEVSWLLGIQFTIQVVPGRGDEVLHVLAGDLAAVAREGSQLCDRVWRCEVPHRAALVIVTIEGDQRQQTWDNVARALAAGSQVVSEEGAIAICSELSEPLGPGLQHVVGAEDLDGLLHEIGKHPPVDALPATELIRAVQQRTVYLLSQLADDLVEDLGVRPIQANQISRLAAHFDSCIVLTNAQYSLAHSPDDRADKPRRAKPKSRK